MKKLHTNSKAEPRVSRLKNLLRRDYILLPLISFTTALFLFVASEILTRVLWPEQTTNACMIEGSNRFKPNCNVRLKNAEGPWASYHYNECGYRSAASCGTKSPATIRIVILGSSIAYGTWVPYDQMYSTIASGELSRTCNRAVEVQNLAGSALLPVEVYRRLGEALELKPDVVLYLFGTWDIEQKADPKALAERNDSPAESAPEDHWNKVKWVSPALRERFDAAMRDLDFHPNEIAHHPAKHIRTLAVAQHFIFQDRDTYLRTISGDKDDYLRQPFTPAWRQRFADFEVIIGDMADKLRAAGVPLVLVPVPSRKEAALFGVRQLPEHIDPFALGRRIETIASNHGAEYVDLMEAFSRIPDAQRLFYVADAHPDTDAQKVMAQTLIQKLQDGSIPAFSHCILQQTAERGYQP